MGETAPMRGSRPGIEYRLGARFTAIFGNALKDAQVKLLRRSVRRAARRLKAGMSGRFIPMNGQRPRAGQIDFRCGRAKRHRLSGCWSSATTARDLTVFGAGRSGCQQQHQRVRSRAFAGLPLAAALLAACDRSQAMDSPRRPPIETRCSIPYPQHFPRTSGASS